MGVPRWAGCGEEDSWRAGPDTVPNTVAHHRARDTMRRIVLNKVFGSSWSLLCPSNGVEVDRKRRNAKGVQELLSDLTTIKQTPAANNVPPSKSQGL